MYRTHKTEKDTKIVNSTEFQDKKIQINQHIISPLAGHMATGVTALFEIFDYFER